MNRLTLLRRVRRTGPAGLAGALLLTASLAAWFGLVEPERHLLSDTLDHQAQVQTRIRAAAHAGTQAQEDPDEQLQKFFGFFPGTSTLPDWLAVIDHAAQHEKLTLQAGEYRIVRDRLGLITRYQVNLPLHGTYPQIANFLQHVMKEVPIAAIESLSFERQPAGDGQLDAKLRLTLFFGRES